MCWRDDRSWRVGPAARFRGAGHDALTGEAASRRSAVPVGRAPSPCPRRQSAARTQGPGEAAPRYHHAAARTPSSQLAIGSQRKLPVPRVASAPSRVPAIDPALLLLAVRDPKRKPLTGVEREFGGSAWVQAATRADRDRSAVWGCFERSARCWSGRPLAGARSRSASSGWTELAKRRFSCQGLFSRALLRSVWCPRRRFGLKSVAGERGFGVLSAYATTAVS